MTLTLIAVTFTVLYTIALCRAAAHIAHPGWRRILHRRWLWLPAQSVGYGVKLPRVTDGICPACFHDLLKGAQ